METALAHLIWVFPASQINVFVADLMAFVMPVIMLVGGYHLGEKVANVVIDLLNSA